MITLILATGVYVALTGPAFEEWRRRRRERHHYQARVEFLLPSSCRGTDQDDTRTC